MNPRIEKISIEIEKIKVKLINLQSRLKNLEHQKTELENADIVSMVRGVDIAPEELAAFARMFREKYGIAVPDIDTPQTGEADTHETVPTGDEAIEVDTHSKSNAKKGKEDDTDFKD